MWNTPMYDTTKLTLELRDLVENGVNIWDFDYPSYYKDEAKTAFEKKVIDHYYFRQIGQETTGRFLHMFRSRIREIMPYYIDLYKTAEIMGNIEDPFGNVDVTETFEETRTGKVNTSGSSSETSSGTSSDSSENESTSTESDSGFKQDGKTITENNERRFSNTPQASYQNIATYMTEHEMNIHSVTDELISSTTDDKTVTASGSATVNGTNSSESSSEGESETTNNETVKHTFTKKGNQGVNTYAHDMIEFRQSIINVDMMIITALNDLFLGVY